MAPSCSFLCFLISLYRKMQAIRLIRQVTNPIPSANVTPYLYLISNVKKTFAIYPISGKINVSPANLPIQVDDRLAWIIYNTYAVVPSRTLPNVTKGYAYFWELPPNIATSNCPKANTIPDPISIFSAWRSYRTPSGIMKNIAMALGREYKRLNYGTVILWIYWNYACRTCGWLRT